MIYMPSELGAFPDHPERYGVRVTVLGAVQDFDGDDGMLIRFADGFECVAYPDELTPDLHKPVNLVKALDAGQRVVLTERATADVGAPAPLPVTYVNLPDRLPARHGEPVLIARTAGRRNYIWGETLRILSKYDQTLHFTPSGHAASTIGV